jgi:hypothetical protein
VAAKSRTKILYKINLSHHYRHDIFSSVHNISKSNGSRFLVER